MYALTCPECGRPMELAEHPEHIYPDGGRRKYYRCTDRLFCTATHWAHPDGTPLGLPGDRATKEARVSAHEAIDRLSVRNGWSKWRLYGWLQRITNLTKEEAHIGRFTVAQCEAVIHGVEEALGDRSAHVLRGPEESGGSQGRRRPPTRRRGPCHVASLIARSTPANSPPSGPERQAGLCDH